jgi:hypothetical protein
MVQSKSMKGFANQAYVINMDKFAKRPTPNEPRLMLLASALVFVGAGMSILIQASAHAYCSKPAPPYKPYSFTSNSQIEDYNRRVDSYNRDLESYRRCALSSLESYEARFKEYLRCEARSFGQAYSGCSRPAPPR